MDEIKKDRKGERERERALVKQDYYYYFLMLPFILNPNSGQIYRVYSTLGLKGLWRNC